MKTAKRLLSLVLALAVVLSMASVLAGCNNSQDPSNSNDPTDGVSGENATYTVSVTTKGGMKMSGLDVYVYKDDTLTDMVNYGQTNEEGKVTFQLPKSDQYAVELRGVPEGYDLAKSYAFSDGAAVITLTSSLITGESLASASLALGDVMYDFSVTTPDGTTVTLSEILKEKKMVMLNFWFSTCGPCASEFPYMEEAYQLYKDKMEIIAMSPSYYDSDSSVAAYQDSMGLSFPMAVCQDNWPSVFGVTGYPTSIVIDRYGVICLVEVGGVTSLNPFVSVFGYFTADDYKQRLCENGMSDLITAMKPTEQMPSTEDISAAINSGDIQVTYRAEEGAAADTTWPFVITQREGVNCIKASNSEIENSYAIIYADVTLKAGQAVGFDYIVSSEQAADALVVIVDGEDIYQMSGHDDVAQWKSAYPWVALEDGTYEVALCYLKDESGNVGEDTVYIKNMRVVDASAIDVSSHIPRQAATTEDGFEYTYAQVVLNEKDGYYHVGTADGPLLLANMMNYSEFSQEETLWDIAYNGDADADGRKMYDEMLPYFTHASNSNLNGYCTVTEELAKQLMQVDAVVGFDDADENEWLKFCMYYQVYGNDAVQLEDPIKGLVPFSAYTATLGKNVESNYFYYNRVIMPRGLLAEFVPTQSGVYRITSRNESQHGVEGWIFDENRNQLMVYEQDERLFNESYEISMVYYMEAGKPYYIDIAFWDPYEVGYIYYDIEYIASTLEHFRLASPGPFTYDSDESGDTMYHTIAGGIKAVLGEDGIYYHDLGNGEKGSKIYVDFTGITGVFSNPIVTVDAYNADGTVKKDEDGNVVKVKGMIDMGGFDFSKTENDLYIISILEKYEGDQEKTLAYLKDQWGEDYDAYVEEYQLDDVFEGRYHGKGEDLTDDIQAYISRLETSPAEREGCVVVTEELAQILQKLMDKYTFAGVEQSWLKLCYYYDYLGPNK